MPDDEIARTQQSGRSTEGRWGGSSANFYEIAIVLLVYITSIFVVSFSYKAGGLYNDNITFFALFRDNAFSLNRFGEPAWWLPRLNFGQPGYMAIALGPLGFSPGTTLFGLVVWALGAAGYLIPDFRHLYVAYAFVLLPTIFMGCLWVLSREFQNRYTRILVFAMGAFSPVLIQTVSDPGAVETAGYSLLCVATVLRYIRSGTGRSFFALVFAFSLLFHSMTYVFVFWGLPFVAMLGWAIFGPRSLRKLTLRAIGKESKLRLAIGVMAVVISTLPFLAVHTGASGFSNFVQGDGYDVKDLVPGNPLQLLLMSTPGVHFQWDFYRASADHLLVNFFPRAFGSTPAFGYSYLGIACLPLVLVGLVHGRRAVSRRLGLITLALFAVVVMSGFSPFYAMFALASKFMLANNHYSDALFSSGAGFVPMFLAILGFDRIANGHQGAARLAFWALLPSAGASITLLLYLNRGSASQFGSVFGFAVFTTLATAYGFYGAGHARTKSSLRRYSSLLVSVILIDIATVGFWQIRTAVDPSTAVKNLLPTTADSLEVLHRQGTAGARNLMVRREQIPFLRKPLEMKPLVEISDPNGRAVVTRRTFNEMTVKTSSPQGTSVLIRDAWDPHWKATVNDKPAPIERSGIFKSIAVPPGPAEIRLRYSPDALKTVVLLSYAPLILVGFFAAGWLPNNRRKPA